MKISSVVFLPVFSPALLQADELARLDRWLNKTEDKLEGGKIQRPGSIVDACQVCFSKHHDT